LAEERDLLRRLLALMEATDAPETTAEQLRDVIDHLDALFLVVVAGEFNAGKSTALNALFGERVMEEGPIPTTAKITILRHGQTPLTRQQSEFVEERRVPADLLRHLTLVDTPGTNSVVREHQRITEDFVPRSDLLLFVTSYDRPLTESERQFLEYVRADWGRRLVVVLNKADLADGDADLRQVIDYLKTNVQELLGLHPQVFAVSARDALRAKLEGDGRDDPRWAASRFQALERFVTETLAGPDQVALKLAAPLETAERLLDRLTERLAERQRVLEDDRDTLAHLRQQAEEARADLEAGYARHLDAIEDVFADVRRRGLRFLDDTIRVSRIGLLRDRERFRQRFSEQVVSETTRQVERVVTGAVDDLLARAMRLQQELFRTFAARVEEGEGRTGRFAADRGFAYDRREVFDGIMQQAERQIRSHDVRHEVGRIVENVYSDTNLVVGAGVGAAAAGGLGAVLIVTSALDALGGLGLATGAAAALYGATVLPRQRAKAKREFTDRIDALQDEIATALRERLDREIDAALDRVWATIEPFAGFVEKEDEALADAETERAALAREIERLREAVRRDIGEPQA
jgi:GTP-binding protein EngB required for normal cell division